MRFGARLVVFLLWLASLGCTGFLVGALLHDHSKPSPAAAAGPSIEGQGTALGTSLASERAPLVERLLWAGVVASAVAMVVLFAILRREIRREKAQTEESKNRKQLIRQARDYAVGRSGPQQRENN